MSSRRHSPGGLRSTVLNLFQSTADGACGVDERQRIVLWNKAAETLLGFKPCEVLGHQCYDVFCGAGDDGRPSCKRGCALFAMARAGNIVPTRNLRVRTRSGEGLWVSLSTILVPLQWRELATLVHLFRDVTRYKAFQNAAEQLMVHVAPPTSASPTASPASRADVTPTMGLTRRELEVVRQLASGRSTRTIGRSLAVSDSTVRNHVHNIFAKLDVHSRLEAVMTAARYGLL